MLPRAAVAGVTVASRRAAFVGQFPAILPRSSLAAPSSCSFQAPVAFDATQRLFASNDGYDDDDDDNEVTPTWTYTPHRDPAPPKRSRRKTYSNDDDWVVPDKVQVPLEYIEMTYSRSSGAGGQNVNKVNTKADLKLHVPSATWLPEEVRDRLMEQQSSRITKDGYLVMYSQEYRTQAQNRKDVISKLQTILRQAYIRPKIRKQYQGVSQKAKERNKEEKKRRSQIKENRRKVEW